MKHRTEDGKTTGRVRAGLAAMGVFMIGGLAACTTTSPKANESATNATLVSAASNATYGTILESSGKALYTLQSSSAPCDSACTKIWPALLLARGMTMPTAGSGVTASNLGTVNRGGGELQVTYLGKPLYFYSGDAAGQVNGNLTDVWGKWTVVVTASPVGKATSSPTGTTASTLPPAGSPTGGKTNTPTPTTVAPSPTTSAPTPATTMPSPTTTAPTTTTTAPGGGGGVGF